MNGLYPTKTRLALLHAIDNAQVLTDITARGDVIWLYPDAPTSWHAQQRVTSRVRELERAGWVWLGGFSGRYRRWQITAAGRAVLDTHGGRDETYVKDCEGYE